MGLTQRWGTGHVTLTSTTVSKLHLTSTPGGGVDCLSSLSHPTSSCRLGGEQIWVGKGLGEELQQYTYGQMLGQ